jgi:MtrB/PioB family decaheme-associated outer membrane protein
MSKKMKQAFKMTALAAALLAAYGPALADGPVNYLYGSVPAEGPERSWISYGFGNWSNNRPQTGIYDGMRDDGTYLLLDADMVKLDEATGTWLGLKARYLGLDDREVKLDWQRQGRTGFSLEYSRIPRDYAFTYNTGLRGIGGTPQTVANIAPGTGLDVDLGTVRDRVTAKFFQNLGVGLNFNVSFRNETKEGTRPWGRGGSAEFMVEPIDSTIRILDAALNYSRGGFQLSGGYYGTSYNNQFTLNTSVGTVINSGSNIFYTSLPLDNQSHELYLNGGYNFTRTTRGTFKASYSQATQNEHLPTADVAGVASPRAPTNLDGKLVTTLAELGLTSKPMPKLSIVANLRYRDFDDQTPVQGIVFNAAGTPTVFNTPFSYTNTIGKLEATYLLPQAFSLLGGVEYNAQDRTVPNVGTLWVPFRANLDEWTYRLRLNKSMSETVNGSLSYQYSDRDGGNYTLPNTAGEAGEDRINPMNIADRKRDKWKALVDWSPVDRLAFQFVIEDAKDDYGGPNSYGLQEGTFRLYAIDASYQVNSAFQVHAWYSYDKSEATETTPTNITGGVINGTKYNDLTEEGNSFGVGVKGKVSSNLRMGGNVEQFRSVNKYNQSFTGATLPTNLVQTPDITNKLLRVKLYAQYAVQKNAELGVNLIRELWHTNDWSWNMFPAGGGTTPWVYCGANCTSPFATATDGTTVTANPGQNSTFAGVRYTYRF